MNLKTALYLLLAPLDEGIDFDEVENIIDTTEVDTLIPYADCPYELSDIVVEVEE